MSLIAIDIAIIPPEKTLDKLIRINSELKGIKLTKKCLPHLTILMGAVNTKNINRIKSKLQKIKKDIIITLYKAVIHKEKNNDSIWLLAQKTKQLMNLHNEVYKKINNYFVDSISQDMFYNNAQSIPEWWKSKYHKTKILNNYEPHITIGSGKIKKIDLPIIFKPESITVFHLSKGCLCEKSLFKT